MIVLLEILTHRIPITILVRCPYSLDTLVTFKEFGIMGITEEIDDTRDQQHSVEGNLLRNGTAFVLGFELL